jgi:hypothetical protein
MLPVRLLLDAKNNLTAEATRDDAVARALVRFLSADLAGDVKHCQALIEGAAEVVAGKKPELKISGNSYGLTITPKTTELRALFTKDSPVTVPTSEFVDLVAQWQGLLGRPPVG